MKFLNRDYSNRLICRLLFGLALMCGLQPVSAHHSQAHFTKEFSEFTGELLAVDWRNPHIRLTLKSKDAQGKEVTKRIETNSMYYLQRAGLTKDRVSVGDQVKIGGYENKTEGGDYLAAEIEVADGEHFFLIRDGVTSLFKDKIVDAKKENKGIYRVWSIPQNNDRKVERIMTTAAAKKHATFDVDDNFSTRCEKAGMPRLMWYPHPYEFVDQGNKILMRLEMYNTERVIHMDQTERPEKQPYTLVGYSTGKWEDSTLVVKTTGIDWDYFDTRGVPQSYAMEVIEKFTLSEDQTRLDYHITATDPLSFTEPALITGHWLALGESIEEFNCELY